MSLPVPLTVSVAGKHITQQVESLSFRREAVGGVRSISFRLRHPVAAPPGYLDPLAQVIVYDARSAEPVAQARVADTGRSTGDGGQSWDVVAFGPVQHASDITLPLVYVDRDLAVWRPLLSTVGTGATYTQGAQPGVADPSSATNGLLSSWADGTAVTTDSLVAIRYSRIWEAGQKLARVSFNWISGGNGSLATWVHDAVFCTAGDWAAFDLTGDMAFSTAGGLNTYNAVTHFANGRDTVDMRTIWRGGVSATTGDANWHLTAWPVIEAMRLDKSGAEVTSSASYSGAPTAADIVGDLLGRVLPDFDGASADIDTSGTFAIEQMAYPDGITAAQVLEDLMQVEGAFRWYTTPDTTGNGYGFRWEPWPTTVRYEATMEDGGSFPISTQDVYNSVMVRWKDNRGDVRVETRTAAAPVLDDQGLTRRAFIDLSAEVGSLSQAEEVGDTFLADHSTAKNGGTLSIARPIRDLTTGRMVEPFEIEAGELIRVRGVESYPDALNADSHDGQTVFRIFAVDYTSDDNRANLSLDTDPKTTSAALALLLSERRTRR